jgi:alkyl hydroperoxide reductase subunit AhpC
MSSLVTKLAPQFKGKVYKGLTKDFAEKSLADYKGKYLLLVFYPLDFTFVCPTEIIELNKLKEEFSRRNCEILCCSTDSHFSHMTWD